jgi:hypothetical protein
LHNQRPDPDGNLIDLEGPPTAEHIREGKVEIWGHAGAFLELGSRGFFPYAREIILTKQTFNARARKAAKLHEFRVVCATAIREIAADRKIEGERLLRDGELFVRDHLLSSVNEKLKKQQLPATTVSKIRATIRKMKCGDL